MPLTQGDDLNWYEEYTPDDHTIGHFRGDLESLNIENAQSGFHYYYCSSNENDLVRFINKGWTPVGPDDPESYGAKRLKRWNIPTSLGTERAYKDVVLMKIPIERYAELRAQDAAYRKELLSGVVTNFEERGEQRARELHRPPSGRSLYYARAEHGQTVEER